mmetsp:Transcript_13260/g.25330  ORF Transcript_13260/g.25330 Transcript_13260/m.25330 type:complete len:304 (-) Transcript_13260:41-952(-)
MEHTMTFQSVMRSLPHEHLRQTQLHVRLRKFHLIWLSLRHPNLICARDGSVWIGIVNRLGPLLKQNIQELDAQSLCIMIIHAPRQNVIRNRWKEHAVPLKVSHVIQSNGISHTRNADCLQHTSVAQLHCETLPRHEHGLGSVVWFQTSNIMRISLLNHLNEACELYLELLADSLLFRGLAGLRASRILSLTLLHAVNFLDQVRGVLLEERYGCRRNFIAILLQKVRLRRVLNISRKVPDAEDSLGLLHPRGTVPRIVRNRLILFREIHLIHFQRPILILPTCSQFALVVQQRKDTLGPRTDVI